MNYELFFIASVAFIQVWENSKMSNEEKAISRLIWYVFDRVKIERCTEHVRSKYGAGTEKVV